MVIRKLKYEAVILPNGLRELLSDISREVLRAQPESTYPFIANFLSALLVVRENAIVAVRIVNSITDFSLTMANNLKEIGLNQNDAEKVASIIQYCFRRYMELKSKEKTTGPLKELNILLIIKKNVDLDYKQCLKLIPIIRAAFVTYQQRFHVLEDLLSGSAEFMDWEKAAKHTLELYKQTYPSSQEMNRAAEIIQSAYKAYYLKHQCFCHLTTEENLNIISAHGSQGTDVMEKRMSKIFSFENKMYEHVRFEPKVILDSTRPLACSCPKGRCRGHENPQEVCARDDSAARIIQDWWKKLHQKPAEDVRVLYKPELITSEDLFNNIQEEEAAKIIQKFWRQKRARFD